MADLNELRKLKSSNQNGYDYNGADTLSRYLAKKNEWNSAKAQSNPAYADFQERYYNPERPQVNNIDTPNVQPITQPTQRNLDNMLDTNYKLTKEDKKYIKERQKELLREAGGNKLFPSKEEQKKLLELNNSPEYNKLLALETKGNAGAGFTKGVINSFGLGKLIDKTVNSAYEQVGLDVNSNDILDNAHPVAKNIGYGAGKIAQYSALSPYISAIPGVSTVSAGVGGAIGKGVASATGGKIAADVAAKAATNIVGDTLVDVALDTVPEAISNAYKGKTVGEITQDALKNVATNIGFNLGGEALGGVFNALKTRKLNKQELEIAQKALDQMDDVQKAAVAESAGFESLEEMQKTVAGLLPAKGETTNPILYYDPEQGLSQSLPSNQEIEMFFKTHPIDNPPINLNIANKVLDKADLTGENAVDIAQHNFDIVEKEIDEYLKSVVDEYSHFKGDGVSFIEIENDYGAPTYKRISNNPKWYRDLYKSVGRTPTKAQKAAAGEKAFWADVASGGGEFLPKEIAARYNAFKGLADELKGLPINTKAVTDEYAFSAQKGYKPYYSPVQSRQVLKDTRIDDIPSLSKNALNSNKIVDDVNLPKQQLKAINEPKQAITNDYIASEVSKSPELTTPIEQSTLAGADLKRRSYEDTLSQKTGVSNTLQKALINEKNLYEVAHNKDTIERAANIIDTGFDNAFKEFNKQLEARNPEAIVLGDYIADKLIQKGDKDGAVDVVRRMSEALTQSGQFSQAAAIALLKNDPATAMRYLQRDLDKLNEAGLKKFKDKWKDFNLTDEEFKKFKKIKSGDGEAIKNIFDEIGKRISKEYPSTMIEQLTELRRVSWLLNPLTQSKNIGSNFLLKPLTDLSNKTSAVIQNAYSLMNKDFKPNQAILVTKDAKKLSDDVWNTVKDSLDETNKYLEVGKTLNVDKQVFKEGKPTQVFNNLFPGVLEKINAIFGKDQAGIMETIRNFTYYLLDKGDSLYVKKNFKSRLGSYIQAKGIKNIDDVPPEAIAIAYQEALRATFKDDTALSKMLSDLKRTVNSKTDGIAGEVILPFTKTPANMAMRGIDFSPAGLVNTFSKAKNGADANLIIDELSKNLTGSALIAVGIYLANKGVITGASPDNKRLAAYERQKGIQPFSIKIGNTYVAYDWAQPAAIPLIIGATIADSEGQTPFETAKKAVISSGDAWLRTSPLQTVNDIFGGFGSPTENIANTFLEVPSGFIPSALGATARVADTTQRATYSKNNTLKTQLDIAKSKIPGLSKTLPASYDTWGREIKRNSSTGTAAISQYALPSRLSTLKETEVDNEINRLYEKFGDTTVLPAKASYTITKNGTNYDLNNKEYSLYQKTMGENSYNNVKAFMNNKAYSKLDDNQKLNIIHNIYKNSKEIADHTILGEKNVFSDKELETKIKKVYLKATPENVANYFIAKEIINNSKGTKDFGDKIVPGSLKQNAINNLVAVGFSKEEATRVYNKIREKGE